MQLLAEIARGAYETIRETLPSAHDERELRAFVAGLAYGLVIYAVILLLVSWGTITAIGRG